MAGELQRSQRVIRFVQASQKQTPHPQHRLAGRKSKQAAHAARFDVSTLGRMACSITPPRRSRRDGACTSRNLSHHRSRTICSSSKSGFRIRGRRLSLRWTQWPNKFGSPCPPLAEAPDGIRVRACEARARPDLMPRHALRAGPIDQGEPHQIGVFRVGNYNRVVALV